MINVYNFEPLVFKKFLSKYSKLILKHKCSTARCYNIQTINDIIKICLYVYKKTPSKHVCTLKKIQ